MTTTLLNRTYCDGRWQHANEVAPVVAMGRDGNCGDGAGGFTAGNQCAAGGKTSATDEKKPWHREPAPGVLIDTRHTLGPLYAMRDWDRHRQGEMPPVANLGDLIKDPLWRKELADVLDTHVTMDPLHRAMASTQRMPDSPEVPAWISFNPERMSDRNKLARALLHEAAHIKRIKKGRKTDDSGTAATYEEYRNRPEEKSAERYADYLWGMGTPVNKPTSLSRTFDPAPGRRTVALDRSAKPLTGGHWVTINHHPVYLRGDAGHVPARVKHAHGTRFTRKEIESTLVDHHKAMTADHGGATDAELEKHGGVASALTFRHKLPSEITERYEKDPHMLGQFRVAKPGQQAHGHDAMGGLGERYFHIVESRAGGHSVKTAKNTAHESSDPEVKFLAHVHDNMSTGKDRAELHKLDPKGLRVGDSFKVNGQSFRVAEDEHGYRVLKAGRDYSVDLDALSAVPADKGSFKPGRAPKREKAMSTPDDGIPFSRSYDVVNRVWFCRGDAKCAPCAAKDKAQEPDDGGHLPDDDPYEPDADELPPEFRPEAEPADVALSRGRYDVANRVWLDRGGCGANSPGGGGFIAGNHCGGTGYGKDHGIKTSRTTLGNIKATGATKGRTYADKHGRTIVEHKHADGRLFHEVTHANGRRAFHQVHGAATSKAGKAAAAKAKAMPPVKGAEPDKAPPDVAPETPRVPQATPETPRVATAPKMSDPRATAKPPVHDAIIAAAQKHARSESDPRTDLHALRAELKGYDRKEVDDALTKLEDDGRVRLHKWNAAPNQMPTGMAEAAYKTPGGNERHSVSLQGEDAAPVKGRTTEAQRANADRLGKQYEAEKAAREAEVAAKVAAGDPDIDGSGDLGDGLDLPDAGGQSHDDIMGEGLDAPKSGMGTGLFGQGVIDSSGVGKQAGLFHEANAAAPTAGERVGSKAANDPGNTSALPFPATATNKLGQPMSPTAANLAKVAADAKARREAADDDSPPGRPIEQHELVTGDHVHVRTKHGGRTDAELMGEDGQGGLVFRHPSGQGGNFAIASHRITGMHLLPHPDPAAHAAAINAEHDTATKAVEAAKTRHREATTEFTKNRAYLDHNKAVGRLQTAQAAKAQFERRQPVEPTPPAAKPAEVPDHVRDSLKRAIGTVKEHNKAIDDARSLEQKVGGGGRYEHDTRKNLAPMVGRAQATVAEFRKNAEAKGIDHDAVLKDLGHVEPHAESSGAKDWREGEEARDAERAKRQSAPTPLAPGETPREAAKRLADAHQRDNPKASYREAWTEANKAVAKGMFGTAKGGTEKANPVAGHPVEPIAHRAKVHNPFTNENEEVDAHRVTDPHLAHYGAVLHRDFSGDGSWQVAVMPSGLSMGGGSTPAEALELAKRNTDPPRAKATTPAAKAAADRWAAHLKGVHNDDLSDIASGVHGYYGDSSRTVAPEAQRAATAELAARKAGTSAEPPRNTYHVRGADPTDARQGYPLEVVHPVRSTENRAGRMSKSHVTTPARDAAHAAEIIKKLKQQDAIKLKNPTKKHSQGGYWADKARRDAEFQKWSDEQGIPFSRSARSYDVAARRWVVGPAAGASPNVVSPDVVNLSVSGEVVESPTLGRDAGTDDAPRRYFWKRLAVPTKVYHPDPRIGDREELTQQDVDDLYKNTKDWMQRTGGRPFVPLMHVTLDEQAHLDLARGKKPKGKIVHNLGWINELRRDPDGGISGLHEMIGRDAILHAQRNESSVSYERNFQSGRTGKKYNIILRHNACVFDPVLEGLGDFSAA